MSLKQRLEKLERQAAVAADAEDVERVTIFLPVKDGDGRMKSGENPGPGRYGQVVLYNPAQEAAR